MSLFSFLKNHVAAQFLEVIEWVEDDPATIVYRFPVFNRAIQNDSKLVVREGQAAVFVSEGRMSDVFGPGTYSLSTRNEPIQTFFASIRYKFDYPFKGDVYFVNTRQFLGVGWGTPTPIPMRDPTIGPVRLRSHGTFAYRVTDPAQFLREVVGTAGLTTTEAIHGQLRSKLVTALADAVASEGLSVLDLATRYMELGEALCAHMRPWFEQHYGISLTDFTINAITLPPKVEEMLDRRSSMGVLGDMGAYTRFQAANALEQAAANPGGGAGAAMMNAGIGLAMGQVMAGQVAAAPPPPPPQPQARRLHYSGPGGQAQLTPQEIAERVVADRAGAHHVWAPGWPAWKPWNEVPEIAALVPPPPPPPTS